MATVIVDWLKLRDQLLPEIQKITILIVDENSNSIAKSITNDLIVSIRSGRKFDATKYPQVLISELLEIYGIHVGVTAAIGSVRAGT